MAPSLLGPPEIYVPLPAKMPSSDPVSDAGKPPPVSIEPFIGLMTAQFNAPMIAGNPPMGLTENFSPTFLSTGNPCLDFFFHVVPDTPPETVTNLLKLAWAHNPLMALKLICQLRGVQGTGKSDREGCYTAALWLHENHPKTLALNIRRFSSFGYLKDLPEILHRLVAGSDVRKTAKEDRMRKKLQSYQNRRKRQKPFGSRKVKVSADTEQDEVKKEEAKELRTARIVEMAKRAVERYNRDPNYRFLHDQVSDFFAELLIQDVNFMNSGDATKIGLAAKWCPSLDSSFDRSTLLCESIARRVFPRESDPIYTEIEERHYVYRVRERLRKEVLVPLRRILELPEVYMSASQWTTLPYERVASVAMKNYKKHFQKHDPDRFSAYLEQVRQGKAKIAAGALLPHEILSFRYSSMESDIDEVADLQWKRMVDDLAKNGKLKNCLAICDVSGSMNGIPIQVSVALGLLISDLSEEPWKGNLITFSRDPQMHRIEGDSLREKIKFVERMQWDMNTDFQKVFDRILEVAVAGNLEAERMVKRLFVFSDMEFDQASTNSWETDYEAIKRKFEENGYGSAVPEIVFWNLRDSRATPVIGKEKGVALVSGFSKNLLKLFLDGNGIVTPEDVMEAAIAGKEYQKLVVFD